MLHRRSETILRYISRVVIWVNDGHDESCPYIIIMMIGDVINAIGHILICPSQTNKPDYFIKKYQYALIDYAMVF
jgi:hypothetical protein